MRKGFGLFKLFARISIMNEMQYRANFFIQLFQSALSMGTGLIVLSIVFGYTDSLNGWSSGELLAVYGVFYFLGGVMGVVIIPNMWQFMQDVREGTLDYTLTKPEDAQVLISVRQFGVWRIIDILLGMIVLGVAIVQLGLEASWATALSFGATLLMGVVMVYSVLLMASTLAFWFVRVWELMEMFQSLFQAGRWPVGMYPEWLRIGLTYLIPVAFAVTVPAQALTGRLSPELLAGTFIFTVALALISRRVWFFGLKYYAGASA
jgi:ABC-2 type transport system permease protein